MAQRETAVFTNMCMITDGNGNVLVQERADKNWPGIVFPGGHVEYGESFHASVIREVREETGLTVLNPELCGVKQFFCENGDRYVVFMYRADKYIGELRSSDEGRVFWMPRNELESSELAHGFELMPKVMESDKPSELFFGKEGSWIIL